MSYAEWSFRASPKTSSIVEKRRFMKSTVINLFLELQQRMKKDMALLNKAINLEEKKNRAILSANGSQLHALNQRSDQYLQELEENTTHILRLGRSLLPPQTPANISLRNIIQHYLRNNHVSNVNKQNVKKLQQTLHLYHKANLALKKIVARNREALASTQKNIQRALQDMQQAANANMTSVYTPSSKNTFASATMNNTNSLINTGKLLTANA